MTPGHADGPSPTATADAGGVRIAYRRFRRRGGTPLLLVHGTSAHAGWWAHVAPGLPHCYDVVALDLSGHGDSDRRSHYSIDAWASDVLAVVRAEFDRAVVLVGHSVGGLVAAAASVIDPAAVEGVVLVDSIVSDPEPDEVPPEVRQWRPPRAERVFTSLDEVAAGFRLTPPQPEADPVVLRAIAEASVRPTVGGWTWKVDPAIFTAVGRPGMCERLPELTVPVAIVRGELSSLVPPDAGARLAALIGRPVPQFDVPGAHHHLMIDSPAGLLRALPEALDAIRTNPDTGETRRRRS